MTIEFIDGLSDVVIVGATARLQFFVLRRDQQTHGERSDSGQLTQVESPLVLVMPVEALATAVTHLERVRTSLLESGKLRPREQESAKGEERDVAERSVSPNWRKN